VTGRRRPPISVLKLLRSVIEGQRTALEGELDYEIRRREHEPRHLTGFCQIDPLTGWDKRNRHGQGKKGDTPPNLVMLRDLNAGHIQ
jgi:hypothetical protein